MVQTTYDTTVLVLRWWKKEKGRDWAREFFQGKDLPPIYPKDITAFLGLRMTRKRANELFAPHLGSALGYIKEHIAGDTPEYVKLALEDALDKFGGDPSSQSIEESDDVQSGPPLELPPINVDVYEDRLEQDHEAIRRSARRLLLEVMSPWPLHGNEHTRRSIRRLSPNKLPSDAGGSDDEFNRHAVGFYRVLRWAAPSRNPGVGARICEAFVKFKPHSGLRVTGPFASFNLFYRPSTDTEEPLRVSRGYVVPVGSHMYLFGQERVEDRPNAEEHEGQAVELQTSGYPLIVACSCPNSRGNFEGIVLRQTDRDSQVLTARVYFEKMKAQDFGSTIEGAEEKFTENARDRCALYPIEDGRALHYLQRGQDILRLLDARFRNLEPLHGAPEGIGRYAITLPVGPS